MLTAIEFKNYKSFKDLQRFELRKITILIGKNSAGKSAISKLPVLIENSLSGDFEEPFLMTNKNIEFGEIPRDLIYSRKKGVLEFSLEENNEKLKIAVSSGDSVRDLPKVVGWQLNNTMDLVYNGNNYINETDEEEYICDFRGFNLCSLLYKERDGSGTVPPYKFNLKTDYIGPFRALPKREYPRPESKTIDKIGTDGEAAYIALIQDDLNSTNKELLTKVSDWYKQNFEGWSIKINKDKAPKDYQIDMTRTTDLGVDIWGINIKDVGQGMSQSLPLVVRAFMPVQEETLIVIEQPELHLHPAAHGNLAQLFSESTRNTNKRYLIETHSKNFVLRFRRLVAEGLLNKEDVVIYYVDFDEKENKSILSKIEVQEGGKVSFWPDNIFNESFDEAVAIRTAQLKNEENES